MPSNELLGSVISSMSMIQNSASGTRCCAREIKEDENGKLYTTGVHRTGCMFCMYGLHCEKKGETRFDKMKQTHPKQYDYCMNQLGLKTVIDAYLKCSPRKDSK